MTDKKPEITEQDQTQAGSEILGTMENYDESAVNGMFSELEQADKEAAPDFDPLAEDEAEKVAERDKKALQVQADKNAQQTAALIVDTYETVIKTTGHRRFTLDDETKENVAAAYIPLMKKYNISQNDFMERWGTEIFAGYFSLMMVKESMAQVKELKTEDRAAAAAKNKAKQAAEKSENNKIVIPE
jgi:hypothetical protein